VADPSYPEQKRRRSQAPLGLALVLSLAIAPAVMGCGFLSGGQGNPADPVLVTGRVLDADGRPVGGAQLQLQVNDFGAADVGEAVPVVFHQSFSANADGTFALHLAPTPALLELGAKEGGFVNFDLTALVGTTAAPWGFPRELSSGTWAGEPPFVELWPIGSMPEPPGVPAPEPAAT
jgi:hypothetical protein